MTEALTIIITIGLIVFIGNINEVGTKLCAPKWNTTVGSAILTTSF